MENRIKNINDIAVEYSISDKKNQEKIRYIIAQLGNDKKISDSLADAYDLILLLHDKALARDDIIKLKDFEQKKLSEAETLKIPGLVPFTSAPTKGVPKPPGSYQNHFYEACGLQHARMTFDDGIEIDYLGLKNVLNKLIEEQASKLYRGIPDITMDTLVLTVSFEIIIDATTGALTIFRLFPTIVPATVDFHPDHLHTLKLTLHGRKNKTPVNARNLTESCRQRLSSEGADKSLDICQTQIGQLLESIANSASNSSSSSSGQ